MGRGEKDPKLQSRIGTAEGERGGGYLHLLDDVFAHHGLLAFSFRKEQERNRKKQPGCDRTGSENPQVIIYPFVKSSLLMVDAAAYTHRGPPCWR